MKTKIKKKLNNFFKKNLSLSIALILLAFSMGALVFTNNRNSTALAADPGEVVISEFSINTNACGSGSDDE